VKSESDPVSVVIVFVQELIAKETVKKKRKKRQECYKCDL